MLTRWWFLVKKTKFAFFFPSQKARFFCILPPADLIGSVPPIYFCTGIRSSVESKSNPRHKYVLNLIDKHFPQSKIFNRNIVEISYSFTNNLSRIIYNHNRKLFGHSHMDNKRTLIFGHSWIIREHLYYFVIVETNVPWVEGVIPKMWYTKLTFSPWKVEMMRKST